MKHKKEFWNTVMKETITALCLKRGKNEIFNNIDLGCHKTGFNEQMMNILIDKKMVVNDEKTHYIPTDKLYELLKKGINWNNCYNEVFFYK